LVVRPFQVYSYLFCNRMIKQFFGVVDSSAPNTFIVRDGEIIETHRLGILIGLELEKGIRFEISKQHPKYVFAQTLEEGNKVKITAHSDIRNDGRIAWKLDDVEVIQ